MQTKARYRFMLIMAIIIFTTVCYQKAPKELANENIKPIVHKSETDPDKNLLIGEWSKTGTPFLIRITGVLDIGKLEVGYYSQDKIEIEMANWSKLGTLLSVYIELKDPVYPGSGFKLNYIPERDVLVGDYFDAVDGMIYPVEFIRIK